MATLWTSKYTIYNTSYGWMYGYASYTTSESNTAVTVSCTALGEASTEGPGDYTETASASLSLTFGGNTVASGSFSSSRSRRCDEGVYKYYPTGGSGSKSISKGTTATTATLKLTYSIRGTSYTGSVSISIPALTKHTVSYHANGGSGAPSAQTKYYGKNITLSSTKPTRTGYTFMGWGSSSSDTSVDYAAGATYSVNQTTNVTLYAIWKKDITLSYNANGGEGAPASQTQTVYNATTSTSFTISSTRPIRSNYNFLGWLDGSTLYQPGDTISNVAADKELVASWELAYIPPQITSLQGARLENNNSQAKITINWTKGNDGSDIATTQLLIAYKLNTSSTWTYVTNTTGSTSSTETWINSSNTTYETTINTPSDNQYDIQAKVRNSNYTSYEQTKTSFISATFYVIDITANGKGIGLLTTAPNSGININGNLRFLPNNQISGAYLTYKDSRGNTSLRPTSADIAATGINGITAILASSQMTTNRPGEGTIIHCEWDNNGGWNSQLFVADNDTGNGKPFVAVRGQKSGTWTAWDRLLAESDIKDYVVEEGPVSSPAWWKYYRKWNSGLFELDGYYSGTPTTGSHYSNVVTDNTGTVKLYGYRSEGYTFPSVCVPVEDNYTVLASWRIGTGFAFDCGTVGTQTTEKFNLYAIGTHGNQTSIAVRIYVRGRWK